MKKWIWAAAACLVAWNIFLSVSLFGISKTISDNAPASGSGGTVVVNNTVNGYTTDITKTAELTQAKIVTVTAYVENETARTASGIIYTSDAEETDILTSFRILNNAIRITVTFDNGVELDATVIGSDVQTDLSLLKTT
ncbi:MAG: hypothetical protein EOM64_10985, partial [Erysipelotrichia bacterium]|nr:hypothetical protein [Erysipelotrichia bacterium]